MFFRVLLFLALACPAASGAEPVRRLDPADPRAAVPALQYQSAFAGYRSYHEPKLGAWRELNEAVGKHSVAPPSAGQPPAAVEVNAQKPAAPHGHQH